MINQRYGHIHHGLLIGNLIIFHKSSPLSDMNRRCFYQPYIPIYTRTGIPARRFVGIIQAYRQNIFLSCFDIRSKIQTIRCITIRPPAYVISITPNRRIGHCSIYIQVDSFLSIIGLQIKTPSIPSDSPIR